MSKSENRNFPQLGKGVIFGLIDRALLLAIVIVVYVFTRIFCKVKVSGKGHFPRHGRVLVLANHPSVIGIFATMYGVFWPWVFLRIKMFPYNVGRQKYLKPLPRPLRWLVRHFQVTELPDKDASSRATRSQIVRTEVELLTQKRDCALWLFPEGTRTPAEEYLAAFRPGIGRVVAEAFQAGSDFQTVFVCDKGSKDIWPKGQKLPNWPVRFWHGIPYPCRFPVELLISRPFHLNSSREFRQICQDSSLEEVGQPVADYLHALFLIWLNAKHLD